MAFGRRNLVQHYAESLTAVGVTHKLMSGKEANQRYPMQLQLPDDYITIFEGDGGILRANKALAAMQVCVCGVGVDWHWVFMGVSQFTSFCRVHSVSPAPGAICQMWRGVVGQAQGNWDCSRACCDGTDGERRL